MYKSINWSKINYLWSFNRNKLFAGHVKKIWYRLLSFKIYLQLPSSSKKLKQKPSCQYCKEKFNFQDRKIGTLSENKWPVQLKRTEDRGPSNKLPKNIDERIRKQFLLRHESAIRSCKNLPLKTTQAGLGYSWVNFFSFLDKQICSYNLSLYFGGSWGQLLK